MNVDAGDLSPWPKRNVLPLPQQQGRYAQLVSEESSGSWERGSQATIAQSMRSSTARNANTPTRASTKEIAYIGVFRGFAFMPAIASKLPPHR